MNGAHKWRRWLATAIAGVTVIITLTFWMRADAKPEYRTARVERGTVMAMVSASGTLNPVVSVQVGSPLSGQLKEVLVDFNSEVKRGQVIARLDPQIFEHRLRQAEADLDAARAQLTMQQAALAVQGAQAAQAEVHLAEAKRVLERKQDLMNRGFISAAERDTALAAWNAQAEQAKAARAQITVAEANVRNAEALVKQRGAVLAQARVDLDRTSIRAPLDGIVIKRSVARGQTVAASLQAPELFVIAENLADMRVEVAIDESEIGRIRLGQKASFTVDAFPGRRFDGTVRQIRKSPQVVSNVVTYMVDVSAENPSLELLPGMTANVSIATDSRSGVLKVPNAALRFTPEGRKERGAALRTQAGKGRRGRIFLLGENREPQEMEVELGLTDGTVTEVSSPLLKEGMEVITGQVSAKSTGRHHF